MLRRNAAFRCLWAARGVSFLGDAVATTALLLHVADRTGAGNAVGGLLLAQTLPRLLAPFAGTVADRVDQRRLMLGCELGQGALLAIAAVRLPPFSLLLMIVAGNALLATLFAPAGRGALPLLVSPADLPTANALLGSALNVGITLGPALGGLAVAGLGVRGALAVDALSFLVSAGLLSRLPSLPPDRTAGLTIQRGAFFAETRAGWRFLRHHPTARAVALGLLLVVLFAALDNVALVFLTREVLGADEAGYGLVAAAFGGGMVVATVALIWASRRMAGAALLLAGIALTGTGTLLTGLAPSIAAAAVGQGVAGVGNGLETTASDLLLQRTVPRQMLGRIFGLVSGGAFVASALAYAAGGPLLEATSPRTVFAIAGLGVLASLVMVRRLLAPTRAIVS